MRHGPSACAQIEPDLLASAIGEADTAAARRVADHLGGCRSCRDELRRYQAVEGALGALREEPPPAGMVAAARDRLEARLLDVRSRLLTYRIFPSPFGDILMARSELGVVLVEYLEGVKSLSRSGLRRGGVELVADDGESEPLYAELREYLEGRRARLDWPLDLRLARSDFQRAVLEATAAIPRGGVISYAGLARELGRPTAVRAVAQALRWNPLPIVIPCHRVIGASGALVGYAGGPTDRKQALLTLEGVPVVKARRDFAVPRRTMYVQAPHDTEYCLPTCSSVDQFPLGGILFGSRARAEAVGLRPCTTCRPDLHPLTLLEAS